MTQLAALIGILLIIVAIPFGLMLAPLALGIVVVTEFPARSSAGTKVFWSAQRCAARPNPKLVSPITFTSSALPWADTVTATRTCW